MGYYSAIKSEEIMLFSTTWMDLEGIMLSEKSQRKTNTDDLIYMWNLFFFNMWNLKKQNRTHRYREQICG